MSKISCIHNTFQWVQLPILIQKKTVEGIFVEIYILFRENTCVSNIAGYLFIR